ncbi:ribosomal protein S18-alanine N-acetyltransferase [Caldibacillus thermolactis]|jgi:[ribosomal protein S18]-alanine N-acetyltransferase|uniref:[Ribosomal protein bS18]-alanine N-acetyltransferase n=1 Tax=Pallidibacillus thermolactis TaxID=251051 RepID=A0ABT2WIW1_9BACI|nr:ribosomal protein S18-alanine N-acetyltransferase [Pallidibacillus thermolactis]MCU9595605.1 ribosomal protein S18-alanine N-acetyltransferase [Pallidibacillus thermolactis]MCU9602500.1 ribosomal protein S18-alanine N-acetyltransferase [Pallidibacillus thermolactis subsp. kokeshiiformis]MED1672287.1 ribosomal protein S18-alanine N-acetyltransferase [Pallidibacillus thermolactis subsp. kokeshiiformis]
MAIEPFFRQLTIDDIDGILAIENASFTVPWTREAFIRELTSNPYALYIGAEFDGKLIAYGGMWIILDECHITNIAVLPEFRGMKIGDKLMYQMMQAMISNGAKKATLEVRVSNIIAQNMYRKFGFKNGGIRKGYYTDNHEDALIMWVNLYE